LIKDFAGEIKARDDNPEEQHVDEDSETFVQPVKPIRELQN